MWRREVPLGAGRRLFVFFLSYKQVISPVKKVPTLDGTKQPFGSGIFQYHFIWYRDFRDFQYHFIWYRDFEVRALYAYIWEFVCMCLLLLFTYYYYLI